MRKSKFKKETKNLISSKKNNSKKRKIHPKINLLFFSKKDKLYVLIILLLLNLPFPKITHKNENYYTDITFSEKINNIYYKIKGKLDESKCSLMNEAHKIFVNGIIQKFKPKKILEVGVFFGGGSALILNSIQNIKNSHLYSIDASGDELMGHCVQKYFPELLDKWTFYKGQFASFIMESIGDNIDLAIFDTSHFEPGEILDFLMVYPFLKEKAVVIFHDIDHQIHEGYTRQNWAPYKIFSILKGKKYFPPGNQIFAKDIGAIRLERNQHKYIYDYFRALAGQWDYFLNDYTVNMTAKLIKKYYDNYCFQMFQEIIKFNRIFIKDHPKEDYYSVVFPKVLKLINQKYPKINYLISYLDFHKIY